MNKSFTAAIAIAATAGLAMAAIETAPAGYADKDAGGSQILVCNPFLSFTGNATTLADIDGSEIGNGNYIGIVASSGAITKYFWHEGHWYTGQGGVGTQSDSIALSRGDGIVFSGVSGHPLLLSGPWSDASVAQKSTSVSGYKLVGNASAEQKYLGDFSLGGSNDPNKDYVSLVSTGSTKYVYKNGHWYNRATSAIADSVTVDSGDALYLFCQKRPRGTFNVTINVPDDAQ